MRVPHVTHLFAAALCQAHGRENERGASSHGLRFPGSPARASAHVATACLSSPHVLTASRGQRSHKQLRGSTTERIYLF